MRLGLCVAIKNKSGPGKAISLYQQWVGYPQSPVLTATYPYQAIYTRADGLYKYLAYSAAPMYVGAIRFQASTPVWFSYFNGTTYGAADADGGPAGVSTMHEANNDIFNEIGLTTVYFAKTTV